MARRKQIKTIILISLLTLCVLMLNGCAGTTRINNLALPPVSIIEGTVAQIDENGFIITDDSGSIYVTARMPGNQKLSLAGGEKIRVYGNLIGGQKRVFDGYVIRKSTGRTIIINNPTPHFGFILQTAFKE